MVHALKEIWRVSRRNGILIDLRPLANDSPVEVVADGQVSVAGRVDDSLGVPDDTAANEALAQIEREGWFRREQEESFELLDYWDTPEEMKAYVDESLAPYVILPEDVLERAQRLMSAARGSGEGARVRKRLQMVIARLRKMNAPGGH